MNSIEKNGNWHKSKGALKQKYAILTENDQLFREGEKQEVFGKYKINLGRTKEELNKIITNL